MPHHTPLVMPHCIRMFHLIRPDPFQLRRNVTVHQCPWDRRGLEVLVIKKIRSAFASRAKSKAKYVIMHMHTDIVFFFFLMSLFETTGRGTVFLTSERSHTSAIATF